MAASTRTAQFTRLHKILKKYYTPVVPEPNRSVLEHLLFASCLENAHHRAADEAFAALVHTFFDFNEIRVSSTRELSEVIAGLPDPAMTAHHVKRILQSVFEATYSFDLEELRKQNLGPAVERLEKIDGTTRFAVAYVVQSALGGHAIPVDSGTTGALAVVGLATDQDAAAGVIAGLDRAIPKNSGIEFGSLLHQLGADFAASPYSPALHSILLEIEPKAKDRLPSRRSPKRPVQEAAATATQNSAATAPPKAVAEGRPAGRKPDRAAGQEERRTSAEAKKELSGEKAAHVAKEPAKEECLEAKKKPAPVKKKAAADELPREIPPADAAEPSRKKDKEKLEEESALGKKKQAAPAKKAPPKRKAEEAKDKSATDPPNEASGLEGISKRKPR